MSASSHREDSPLDYLVYGLGALVFSGIYALAAVAIAAAIGGAFWLGLTLGR